MRIAFLGTPEFACPSLAAVAQAGHDISLVVSQPDKVRGRRQKPTPTPVRALAERLGLPHAVLHKGKAAREELYALVLDLAPDVVVVVAFGHILREPLLHGARYGCVNVHASLLPRWRGPAPIHRAIVAGDTMTGISTMALEAGVDTGPVYLQRKMSIDVEDTAGDLHDRLAALGGELLATTLWEIERGLEPTAQPEDGVTHAPLLHRSEGSTDFEPSAVACHDRVRGLWPWPGVTVRHADQRLRLVRSRVSDHDADGSPGTVMAIDADRVIVACGEGCLDLIEVQPAARRAMSAGDFARGYHLEVGDRLRPLPEFESMP